MTKRFVVCVYRSIAEEMYLNVTDNEWETSSSGWLLNQAVGTSAGASALIPGGLAPKGNAQLLRPRHCRSPACNVQFLIDMFEMVVHRMGRDEQARCNFLVAIALLEQLKYVQFTVGEKIDPQNRQVVAPAPQIPCLWTVTLFVIG